MWETRVCACLPQADYFTPKHTQLRRRSEKMKQYQQLLTTIRHLDDHAAKVSKRNDIPR